jgi:hypothetical protein
MVVGADISCRDRQVARTRIGVSIARNDRRASSLASCSVRPICVAGRVLASVTLATLPPSTRPSVVNSVPAIVTASPYVLLRSAAVIVSVAGCTSIVTAVVTDS